jgi:hypothetical protein
MLTGPQDFKDAIAKRRKTAEVSVEGLGVVRIRALSAGAVVRFQADVKKAASEGTPEDELSFPLIARSWINGDGEPLYPEAEGEAIARELDPESFKTIVKAVLKLNGMSEDAIEDAEKNSGASRGDSTATGSPPD